MVNAPSWFVVNADRSFLGPYSIPPGESVEFAVDFTIGPGWTPDASVDMELVVNDDSGDTVPGRISWRVTSNTGLKTFRSICTNDEIGFWGESVALDTTPPFTEAFANPPYRYVDPEGRVYVSSHTPILIYAEDAEPPDATKSGLAFVGYKIDAPATTLEDLQEVSAAFTLSEGTHTIVFGSRDAAAGADRTLGFRRPTGLAVDALGRLYVADRDNDRVAVLDPAGNISRSVGRSRSGGGFLPGRGPGEFNKPTGVALGAGRIVVADRNKGRVQVFDRDFAFLFEIKLTARPEAVSSQGDDDEKNDDGDGPKPFGVAVGPTGTIYVTDEEGDVVATYDAQGRPLAILGSSGGDPGARVLAGGAVGGRVRRLPQAGLGRLGHRNGRRLGRDPVRRAIARGESGRTRRPRASRARRNARRTGRREPLRVPGLRAAAAAGGA